MKRYQCFETLRDFVLAECIYLVPEGVVCAFLRMCESSSMCLWVLNTSFAAFRVFVFCVAGKRVWTA